ncbi:glycosyl transferase family, a/b domain-containing protein [Peziza echinospora]|nr:glycosyl transferase family, a/b domain-containing protein [Peziza echinospora]
MAEETVSISTLLRNLSIAPEAIEPSEVTAAIDNIFSDRLSPVQASALLTALHFTKLDEKPGIIAAAAAGMSKAGLMLGGMDSYGAGQDVKAGYHGGLVDIVGTGGDGHNTFNVSTTAAILAASCGIQICKHGNKASTSASGSADILTALGADLWKVTPDKVTSLFTTGQENEEPGRGIFCFLFAPVFHPSMKHVAPIRKELPFRTIFNLLGPLVNPIDYSLPGGLEARIIGVGKNHFGRVFAETLILLDVKKGMVVSGEEQLDEISIAGHSNCWKLRNKSHGVMVEEFRVHPEITFGIKTHPLSRVAGGKQPAENAEILKKLLNGQIDPEADTDERAILDFVLINTAALLVVAGLFEHGHEHENEDEQVDENGVANHRKWKDAVALVREGITSGRAWRAWEAFAKSTQE